jgi:uncharacterized repeat protein (TIGR01451 family)
VFKSTDGGATWSASYTGLANTDVIALAIDPQTPTTLYAGTNGAGVFKSTDGGTNWSDMNIGLTNPDVYALAIDPQTPTALYAGTRGGGVFAIQQVSPTADLSVTKTDSPDPVTVGKPLTYTVTVTNNGPNDATAVTMSDTLPSGVTFVSATPSQGSCSGTSTISCSLGTLAKGASTAVTLVVTPTVAGTLSNTARVSATESDPDPDNNTATAVTTVNPEVVCGDGLVTGSEQCDLGAKNGQAGVCCSATCQLKSAGTECRPNFGAACDVAETCDGVNPLCPANGFKAAGTVCRAARGACDVAESCPGTSPFCPANGFQPSGTACNDGNVATCTDQCTAGACAGTAC